MRDIALGGVSLPGSAVEVRPQGRQLWPHLTGVRVLGEASLGLAWMVPNSPPVLLCAGCGPLR